MNEIAVKHKEPKKNIIYVIIFSGITGIIAQVLSHMYSVVFNYRDAIYRLEKAREFFDTANPGFLPHLGTVWLPVTHILMAPFAKIDFLWYSGIAGGIIGYICFVFNILFLYLILRHYIKNDYAVITGLVVYALNPNLLYFQTTALTEQPYLLFFTAAFYFISEYSENNNYLYLLYSGLFTMLSMGTRYDGWAMFAITAVMLLFIAAGFRKKVRSIAVYSILPFCFAAFWFIYNWVFYGDALEFSRGRYSTLQQLVYYEKAGRLPTKYNILKSIEVAWNDITAYTGVIFLVLTILGVLLYIYKNKSDKKSLLPYLLLFPLPLMVFLLYTGQIIIELPDTNPPGYFNSRYAICILPAIAFFISYIIQNLIVNRAKIKKYVIIGTAVLLVSQQYYYYSSFPLHVPAIAETVYLNNETTYNYTRYLKKNYDGGTVLFDFTIFALSPETRINLRDRITYFTPFIGKDAIKNPKPYAKWVLMYNKAENDSIYISLKDNKTFYEDYNNVFSDGGVNIFKLK